MRGIGVAVMCSTCGAAALGERAPLLDAEAMLLVDDGDGEVGEVDAALDQRVRADGDRRLARREPGAGGGVLLRGAASS